MAVQTIRILIKFVAQLLSGLYKYVILYASIFLGVLLQSQRYPEQIDTSEVPDFDSTDYWPGYWHSGEIGRMRWPYIWTGNKLRWRKKKIGLTKDFKYLGTVTHSLPVTQRGSQASFHPLITWIYPNVKCRMDWFYRKSYTCLLGLSAGTGKLCIFGHLGLVFIWSCFVSCLLLLLYYVICAPVLTEGTCLLFNFQFVKKILPIEHV